ncbi:MAG: hypothetical protein IKZ28_05380 [Clostridia bacterium]|nr:hypothetical protein [Clostridia bacterium]
MKCFIHGAKDAIAACRNCGKGMCSECSAYSGHTGICPECRKKEFERERSLKNQDLKDLTWNIVLWAFLSILLCVTIIFPIIGIIKILINVNEKKQIQARINALTKEIDKLNKVLKYNGTNAFI